MASKTDRILKNLKAPKYEPKNPIANDMFIPNHSGISVHPEAREKFVLNSLGSNEGELIYWDDSTSKFVKLDNPVGSGDWYLTSTSAGEVGWTPPSATPQPTWRDVLGWGRISNGKNPQITAGDNLEFRDAAIYITSSVDGQMDIIADSEIGITTPTLDIDATTIDISGSLVVGGDISANTGNISGAFIYGDGSNLTGISGGAGLWEHHGNYIQPISGSNVISGAGLIVPFPGVISGSVIAATAGNFTGDLTMGEYLRHRGDTDTYIRYQTDDMEIRVGNVNFLHIDEGATDYFLIDEGATGVKTGIGMSAPSQTLEIAGNISGARLYSSDIYVDKGQWAGSISTPIIDLQGVDTGNAVATVAKFTLQNWGTGTDYAQYADLDLKSVSGAGIVGYYADMDETVAPHSGTHVKTGFRDDSAPVAAGTGGTYTDQGIYINHTSCMALPSSHTGIDYTVEGGKFERGTFQVFNLIGGSWEDVTLRGIHLKGWGHEGTITGVSGAYIAQAIYSDGGDIEFTDGDVHTSGTISGGIIQAGNGWTGTFTNGDADTVTVTNGIITDVS